MRDESLDVPGRHLPDLFEALVVFVGLFFAGCLATADLLGAACLTTAALDGARFVGVLPVPFEVPEIFATAGFFATNLFRGTFTSEGESEVAPIEGSSDLTAFFDAARLAETFFAFFGGAISEGPGRASSTPRR